MNKDVVTDLKIKMDSEKLTSQIEQHVPNIIVLDHQAQIFQSMAKFLTRYLDLPQESLFYLIRLTAERWQVTYSVPFPQFAIALPQERLIMAEQFKEIAIKVLGEFLQIEESYDNFKATMEHALLHYMKEFASR